MTMTNKHKDVRTTALKDPPDARPALPASVVSDTRKPLAGAVIFYSFILSSSDADNAIENKVNKIKNGKLCLYVIRFLQMMKKIQCG
jgi:hypothetical protein